jgi:hypothetical protein
MKKIKKKQPSKVFIEKEARDITFNATFEDCMRISISLQTALNYLRKINDLSKDMTSKRSDFNKKSAIPLWLIDDILENCEFFKKELSQEQINN